MKKTPSQEKGRTKKVEKKSSTGWIKFLRVVIYCVTIIFTTVGACLIKSGARSVSYADGTASTKTHVGELIFYISLTVLFMNIFWGILRWFLRGHTEKWKPGQIVGKLIGGGIWRAAVIIPLVIISAIFISPKISDVITNNIADNSSLISFSEKIDRLQYINDNFESLNFDDIKDELRGLLFNNVDFDVDASGNISSSNSIFFQNAYAAHSSTVTVLNKAKLSNTGKFLVFYTDTGDDKITDEQAAELTNMMDEIIIGYKEKLGFDYEYERLENNKSSVSKMQKVLENSGIDKDVIDTAMPVYVVNPFDDDTDTYAFYAGRKWKELGYSISLKIGDLAGIEAYKLFNSAPSYPFVDIIPRSVGTESLFISTAHELGHHYISNYNYSNYESAGALDDFIDETAPNWMAINVLPSQPQENIVNRNHYNNNYLLDSTGDTISKARNGYPAVAFLQNYYEIVPESKEIIMDATYYGDALNYLYEHTDKETFQKVMITLAERNLTGDYDGKLINLETPRGYSLNCPDICERSFNMMDAASTEYVYFSTDEYRHTILNFTSNTEEVSASLLGKSSSGDWEIIESNFSEIEFAIDNDVVEKYETLAVAAANYSVKDYGEYTVGVVITELNDTFTKDTDFDYSRYEFLSFYSNAGEGCYEIDTDALFDDLTNILDFGSKFAGLLSRASNNKSGDGSSSIKTDYNEGAEKVKAAASETKKELAPYKITICGNDIVKGSDFYTVKSKLHASFKGMVNIKDIIIDDDEKYSISIGFDLLARTGKAYILAQSGSNMGLITIIIEEK